MCSKHDIIVSRKPVHVLYYVIVALICAVTIITIFIILGTPIV